MPGRSGSHHFYGIPLVRRIVYIIIFLLILLYHGTGQAQIETEKKVSVEKGRVAFVEIRAERSVTLFVLYPSQYKRYVETGEKSGALEITGVLWYIYPIPAMLEDQTVYFIVKDGAEFKIRYEIIDERIKKLYSGEVLLRSGLESLLGGISTLRLSQILPGLKIEITTSAKAKLAVVKTIDYAFFLRGIKTFDEIYSSAEIKRDDDAPLRLETKDFDDLYIISEAQEGTRIKYLIWATKESAESGC